MAVVTDIRRIKTPNGDLVLVKSNTGPLWFVSPQPGEDAYIEEIFSPAASAAIDAFVKVNDDAEKLIADVRVFLTKMRAHLETSKFK